MPIDQDMCKQITCTFIFNRLGNAWLLGWIVTRLRYIRGSTSSELIVGKILSWKPISAKVIRSYCGKIGRACMAFEREGCGHWFGSSDGPRKGEKEKALTKL